MNKVDKPEAFDLDALRRGQTTVGAPDNVGGERKAEISALARQIAGQYAMANYSPSIVIGQLRFLEFFSLLGIALATNYFLAEDPGAHFLDTSISGFAGALLALLLMQASDCYHVSILRSPMGSMARVLGSWMAALGVVALVNLLFVDHDPYYRGVLAAWFGVGAVYLLVERNLIGLAIRRWGRNGVMERRAVIVGGGEPANNPRLRATLNADWTYKQVTTSMFVNYVGGTKWATDQVDEVSNNKETCTGGYLALQKSKCDGAPSWWTANMSVTWRPDDAWNLSFTVKNLFNRLPFYDPNSFLGDSSDYATIFGRGYSVTIGYRFK